MPVLVYDFWIWSNILLKYELITSEASWNQRALKNCARGRSAAGPFGFWVSGGCLRRSRNGQPKRIWTPFIAAPRYQFPFKFHIIPPNFSWIKLSCHRRGNVNKSQTSEFQITLLQPPPPAVTLRRSTTSAEIRFLFTWMLLRYPGFKVVGCLMCPVRC